MLRERDQTITEELKRGLRRDLKPPLKIFKFELAFPLEFCNGNPQTGNPKNISSRILLRIFLPVWFRGSHLIN